MVGSRLTRCLIVTHDGVMKSFDGRFNLALDRGIALSTDNVLDERVLLRTDDWPLKSLHVNKLKRQ